jgi:hypothetical protein
VFRNPTPTTDEVDRALEALELIAYLSKKNIAFLSQDNIASESYRLFHVIMQAPISPACSREKKWKAFRLAIYGTHRRDVLLPWNRGIDILSHLPSDGDSLNTLTFLGYRFNLATGLCQNQDESNQDDLILIALYALLCASVPVTIEAPEGFDPCDEPFMLREAALFFLPLISDEWFNTPDPIMKPDQMESFCVNWASAVDAVEHTDDVREAILVVLFGMINSPHWRPHIVLDKWDLLEYFTSVPDSFQPLKRCIDNPGLTDTISNVGNPAAMKHWLTILWSEYKGLNTQVRDELETVTKEIAQGRRRGDLDACLSVIDSELGKAELASAAPLAIFLREKVKNLREAKASLRSLM